MSEDGALPVMVVSRDLGIECTMPETDLRHYITDHELDEIGKLKIDRVEQLFWASVGTFLGALIPALDALSHVTDGKEKFGWISLSSIVLAFMSLAILIVTGLLSWDRVHSRKDVVGTIRSRPRVRVSPDRR